jgi:hypothetical protein
LITPLSNMRSKRSIPGSREEDRQSIADCQLEEARHGIKERNQTM